MSGFHIRSKDKPDKLGSYRGALVNFKVSQTKAMIMIWLRHSYQLSVKGESRPLKAVKLFLVYNNATLKWKL